MKVCMPKLSNTHTWDAQRKKFETSSLFSTCAKTYCSSCESCGVLICSSKTFGVYSFFCSFLPAFELYDIGIHQMLWQPEDCVLAISKNQNSWISSDMGSKICFNETHKKNVPLWDVSVRGGCSKAKRLIWLLQRTRFRDLVLVAAVPEAIYGMRSWSRIRNLNRALLRNCFFRQPALVLLLKLEQFVKRGYGRLFCCFARTPQFFSISLCFEFPHSSSKKVTVWHSAMCYDGSIQRDADVWHFSLLRVFGNKLRRRRIQFACSVQRTPNGRLPAGDLQSIVYAATDTTHANQPFTTWTEWNNFQRREYCENDRVYTDRFFCSSPTTSFHIISHNSTSLHWRFFGDWLFDLPGARHLWPSRLWPMQGLRNMFPMLRIGHMLTNAKSRTKQQFFSRLIFDNITVEFFSSLFLLQRLISTG